jgi:hypothetical protein
MFSNAVNTIKMLLANDRFVFALTVFTNNFPNILIIIKIGNILQNILSQA